MDFITIDFETATNERNSACEIGLAFVKNDKIIDTKSWLIKPIQYPYFNPFNISIHGIKPDDVAHKPEFPEIWKEIKPLVENQFVIAHNAGFDFSVLRKTLVYYKLPFPKLNYSCSYIFSKKVWSNLSSYDLKTLCSLNNIPLKHHRAENDARACAELSLIAFSKSGVLTIDDFPDKLKTTVGQLFSGGYKPSESSRIYTPNNPKEIASNPNKHNPESIFYGKTVVFTGTLSSMVRADAQQIIADIGGLNGKTVTLETDYLIVGQQDYRIVGEDNMSNKQAKAVKMIEKGAKLEILSEYDFLNSI